MEEPKHADCGFCNSKILEGDEVFACKKCGAVHHPDCWEENPVCTNYACGCNEYVRKKYSPQSLSLIISNTGDKQMVPVDAKAQLMHYIDLHNQYWKEYLGAHAFEKEAVNFKWEKIINKSLLYTGLITKAEAYLKEFDKAVEGRAKVIANDKKPFISWGWIGWMMICCHWMFGSWGFVALILGWYLCFIQRYFSNKYYEKDLPKMIMNNPEKFDDAELAKLVNNKETALEMFAQQFQEELESKKKLELPLSRIGGFMLGPAKPARKRRNKFCA